MKALTQTEVSNLAEELRALIGARLQLIEYDGQRLALGFYRSSMTWLYFDPNKIAPQMLFFPDINRPHLKAIKKPLTLFLSAHLVGHRLEKVEAPPDLGRVIELVFPNQKSIQFRIIPHGPNVIVRSAEKSLSLFKIQELKSGRSLESLGVAESSPRTAAEIRDQWLSEFQGKPKSKLVRKNENKNAPEAKIKKLQKIINNMKDDLRAKEALPWDQLGEWLKREQRLDVPHEWQKMIEPDKSLAANIELVFKKAKENKRKIAANRERISDLEEQIHVEQLKLDKSQEGPGDSGQLEQDPKPRENLLAQAEFKGRTFELAKSIVLYVGKSAGDNIRLLRVAKPWSYWIHLRDMPSCHGILHRDKGQVVSDEILHQAIQHLLRLNFGNKSEKHYDDKFDVIIAECRFVRPLKGDRVGRVTYSSSRTIRHKFSR